MSCLDYDCSDNCMRIWKGKKGLPTDQLKEMYVEVANQLLPELDSQPKISSDLIPPPISQSSSTGANPVSRNVSDLWFLYEGEDDQMDIIIK